MPMGGGAQDKEAAGEIVAMSEAWLWLQPVHQERSDRAGLRCHGGVKKINAGFKGTHVFNRSRLSCGSSY